jgi:hypothetical protein
MTRTQDYPCRICGAEFITEELLLNHEEEAHGDRVCSARSGCKP